MNYYYLKNQLQKAPVVPMQAESFNNILSMIPSKYSKQPKMRRVIDEVFDETKNCYNEAIKKAIIENVIVAPKVKGLENEKAGPPAPDPQ